MTEDQVRNSAGHILNFVDAGGNDIDTPDFISGTGQLKTFNQLGQALGITVWSGISDKPDGWYLPKNADRPAIILEAKAENVDISKARWANELTKNTKIVEKYYRNVIGILYNGAAVRVFQNEAEISGTGKVSQKLEDKAHYLALFNGGSIDKQKIYQLTSRINNGLHFDFGITNLYHRMIFTACALVAKRYGAQLVKGMNYAVFHQSILQTLKDSLLDAKRQNQKLDVLIEMYSEIRMNTTKNQTAIDNFIEWVSEISEQVDSDYWNGEDVMGIFFNEFNRYKKKSEIGQVFTPDHITSLMCRLIKINTDDRVLDAACGSGAFLVKAMCNMIHDVGGINTDRAREIKESHIYGIEWHREIYALACANMLIHKDGKTNLEQMDTRTQEACDWIRYEEPPVKDANGVVIKKGKPRNITKVLMNPPYENKYGCIDIVKNVLDSVPEHTLCAFILPDKKLEKVSPVKVKRILAAHSLKKIIKLPEDVFFGIGVTTSVFIFETGVPQGGAKIVGYYIEDDGLVTVKNKGRQDVKGTWQAIEDYWVGTITDETSEFFGDTEHHTRQLIDPAEHLSYQMPTKEFEIYEEDFMKTMMDYLMFQRGIDAKEFQERLLQRVLYSSEVAESEGKVSVNLKGDA